MLATDHWPQEWLNKLQEQKCEQKAQKRKTNRACKSVNEAENCPSPITASFFKSRQQFLRNSFIS